MIFIGSGALLWRAVDFASAAGHPVDLVVVPAGQEGSAGQRRTPLLAATDVNAEADRLGRASTDRIVFSINNRAIPREPVLNKGFRIYNIHNGLLPYHRGLPEAAIVYAILNGDNGYGATLHEIDAGIDTGRILDTERFPLTPADGFQDVMLKGLRACTLLFERNLAAIAAGHATPMPQSADGGGYFGRAALMRLPALTGHPEFRRATDLGIFAAVYPELAGAVRDSELGSGAFADLAGGEHRVE
ncbi:formyltransferase family protein [Nocardia inohanensis]|uniref:formyltransferase family protein n=1 Tax=Nocardia inohanensis TaxID=209246 RepID=UPI0008321E94|nr:formyltransferase family protein [Nocardia inohanensis]